MNDKNWSPGTFLPDTISGKELVKTFFKFSMTRAEWIASVAVVPLEAPEWPGLVPLCPGGSPSGPVTLLHPSASVAPRPHCSRTGPR